MGNNTDLILAKAAKTENWEDREKANDDIEVLRSEFDKRLYSRKAAQAAEQKNGSEESTNREPDKEQK
jgi:hypothetical protein